MTFDASKVPRPQSWADYAACYAANVVESRDALERSLFRYRALRQAGQIAFKPEGGYVVTSPEAGRVLGDVLRHRSDLDHWHARKVEAERMAQAAAPDVRLPPEREPGEDDDAGAW